jgi:hypothetical protein
LAKGDIEVDLAEYPAGGRKTRRCGHDGLTESASSGPWRGGGR